MRNKPFHSFLLLLLMAATIGATAQTRTLTVAANKPTAKIQPAMWGLFFEDINFAADGGLYAELIKNRSFEFYKPLMGWKKVNEDFVGQFQIIDGPNENNPRFLRIESSEGKELGLVNEGFRGMALQAGEQYNFSVMARQNKGASGLRIELLDSTDAVIGMTELKGFNNEWQKYNASLTCNKSETKAKVRVMHTGNGVLEIDMVSLFPEKTWKNRLNGLRADLVQRLADLNPGFLRFPGGCIVEGHELETRYEWKKTVGKVEEREANINRWNTEFSYRPAPDYFQSYGLGFYEYFLLSEDIGAEPLPILNCGMACQFNSAELVPLDELDPYIQDVLDLIEFANGDTNTKWGKLRAEMGHPAPFNLKMIGVGNEQWGTQYIDRLKIFMKTLQEKHPEITYVSGSGPYSDGQDFEYLWGEMRKMNAQMVDEHYYKSPDWFLQNAARYDNYDRKGPKVFAGEYAAHDKEGKDAESRNTWKAALAEAAFMTGLERNADVVQMASYAPLFGNVNAWQWRPDLIWFDNSRSVATPNYYIQQLYSTNKGTDVVAALVDGKPLTGQDSLYASAVIDANSSELIVKVANTSNEAKNFTIAIEGRTPAGKIAELQVIESNDLTAYNTLDRPEVIVPTEKTANLAGKKLMLNLGARSFTVVKVQLKK